MGDKQQLSKKIEHFGQAIETLHTVLKEIRTAHPHYQVFLRDSLIQRFEYSIDTFWKLLRELIITKHGIDVPASPKAVLKFALDMYIVDEDQYKLLLGAINDRNLSSHAYHEDIAIEIASHIPKYYECMTQVASTFPA